MEKSNSRQSGLVTEWHQARGLLFTGGDARVVKVWDVHQEMPVMVRFIQFFLNLRLNFIFTSVLLHDTNRIFPLNLWAV